MSKVMLSIVSFAGVVRVITQRSAGWKVAWQHLKWLQRRLYFPLINFLMGWWQPQTLMNMLSESPLERYSLGLGFGLSFKPFAPELPVTALADPAPFYRLWRHQFQMPRTTLPTTLGRVKRYFKPYHNEHKTVKETGEKEKKETCHIDRKIFQENLVSLPTYLPFI